MNIKECVIPYFICFEFTNKMYIIHNAHNIMLLELK